MSGKEKIWGIPLILIFLFITVMIFIQFIPELLCLAPELILPHIHHPLIVLAGWLILLVALLMIASDRFLLRSRMIFLEEDLKQTDSLYKSIVENSFNVILVLDADGVITFINQAVEEQTGITVNLFIGTRGLHWVCREDRPRLLAWWNGPGTAQEIRFRTTFKGRIHYISAHVSRLPDRSSMAGTLCIAMDITNQVKMKEELSASEIKYRSLYKEARVALLNIRGSDGQILMANDQAALVFGCQQAGDLLLLKAPDLWQNPEQRTEYLDLLAYHGSVDHYIFNGVRKDGEVRTFEVFARYNQQLDQIEASLLDITDKNLWEHHVIRQAYVLENIQESVIVLDLDGNITYMNGQARDIFSLYDHIPRNIYGIEKLISNYDGKTIETIRAVVDRHESWQGEISLLIDGHPRCYMHRINPLNENGCVTAVVIISTDINDLVEAREKSETANMAKSQFLANMSHEIRTPMIGILGSVDLLEQSRLTNEQSESVQIIRECGEQLLSIINDILDVSKIEVGLLHLNPQPCNLYDLLTRTINIIDPMLKEKGLKLKLDLDKNLPTQVILDMPKLRQVLINILYNAVKFTPNGLISIQARSEEQPDHSCLLFSISDTGIGISSEQITAIFSPFTQGDSSTSRNFGGTGLGLYICKRLIDLMGGDLGVESCPGEGTTFSFRVPFILALQEEATENSQPGNSVNFYDDLALEFNPIEILVVEDNDLNRKIVSQMLSNYGFQVSLAANGLECLKIVQNRHFDTILMDMQMPVMDGYETTQLICQTYADHAPPIIAMTAHALTGDREKCMRAGCTAYIAKPFKGEDLVQVIRQHLNTSQRVSISKKPAPEQDLVDQLIPEFLAQLEELTKELEDAIQQHNLGKVQSIGHDIKGTAGMYGFMDISHLAASIEESARDRNLSKMRSLYLQLDRQTRSIDSQRRQVDYAG